MRKIMNDSKQIDKIKNQISDLFPHVEKVDIRLKKHLKGMHKAQISVNAPGSKNLFAEKVCGSPSSSLEKSSEAIISQIRKLKNKKLGKRHKQSLKTLEAVDLCA